MNIEKYIIENDQEMLRRANEISQNLGSRRPKLSVSKVPEELRSVRVKLHIPLMHSNEFIGYMPLNFIWSLNDQHVSPHQFVLDLLVLLCVPPHYAAEVTSQLAFQLIEYIERHSFEFEGAPLNALEFSTEKRRPGRPAKNKNGAPPLPPAPKRNWSKSNVVCSNCQFANAYAGYECKKCRLPFAVLEQLNLRDPVQIACTQLYELVTQRVEEGLFRINNSFVIKLSREDFQSIYQMRIKLKEILEDNTSVVDEVFGQLMSKGKCDVIDRSIPRKERRLRQERMIKDSESEVLDESM